MSDAPLSQEAIDALLAAAAQASGTAAAESARPAGVSPPAGPPAAAPPAKSPAASGELESAVRDLDVELVVVFGSTEMTIADVLRLGPGSIVQLDRDASLPVEVRLAGRTVARAEVVTVDDAYALRIVENLVRPAR